jgi:hypothetical protein
MGRKLWHVPRLGKAGYVRGSRYPEYGILDPIPLADSGSTIKLATRSKAWDKMIIFGGRA